MNHICRIVWSETKARWQVACEAGDDSSTGNCPEDHLASCRVPKQEGCASGAVKARLAFYFLLGFRKHGRCFASRRITSGSGIRGIGISIGGGRVPRCPAGHVCCGFGARTRRIHPTQGITRSILGFRWWISAVRFWVLTKPPRVGYTLCII